jgi:NitT/TauT family transport system substrate-binding protein
MIAYLKAARYYDDVLKDGHIIDQNADDVVKILTQYSFIKDPEVHRSIVSHWTDPSGDVNMPSLQMAWQYFVDTKQIDGSIKVDDVIGLSYVHDAAKVLGPYVKKGAIAGTSAWLVIAPVNEAET